MKARLATSTAIALILAASGPAFADHNSKNGEGWANMPNDIHNTRIETKEADDNEAFRDFVKYGEGSRTENRFDTDSSDPAQSGSKQDAAQKQEQKQAESKSENQAKSRNENRNEKRSENRNESSPDMRSESRARQRLDTRSMSRSSRSTATRTSSSRRGGRKN